MDVIPTQLAWPWVLPTTGAVVLVLMVWWGRRTRPRAPAALPVAHTGTLHSLPRYRRLARRHRRLGLLLVAGSLLVVAGAALVVARPQTVETSPRESRARDLMVCLDASASMDDDNAVVVRELRGIVEQLRGDRVGMMIWSSAAVLVFPLTDDYDYVRGQLDRAERAFTGHPDGFYAGVDLPDAGASLIGDGIVSCARRFDGTAATRTRVLLVASDNDPLGQPSYSLPEAAQFAAQRKVLVYGIGAASLEDPSRTAAREEFVAAASRTGGVFTLVGAGGQELITSRIADLLRARGSQLPRKTVHDTPYLGALLAAAGLVLMTGAWWGLRRRTS